MVPHLKTALTGTIPALEQKFLQANIDIEHWFNQQWLEHKPPFYTSCDLRNSGFKIAPVDTNLFPAGFNNLNSSFMTLCIHAVQSIFARVCPHAKKLLLIPENHTRNKFYLDSLLQLIKILQLSGVQVRIGSMLEIDQALSLESASGEKVLIEPIKKINGSTGSRLVIDHFDPCVVLLNNDLSAGTPDLLLGLEQLLLPPLSAGWTIRRKSFHFNMYDQVVYDFAKVIDIDPWLINPEFTLCSSVNFHQRQGEECLADNINAVLNEVKEKYREYDIKETPYVVVKANAGTYGMGIMTVSDASEIVGINRKQRNKMSVIKDGMEVSEVLIQEGVHTQERVNDGVAEPVIYMIDRYVVGGFYRVHSARGANENLNAPGMHFEPLSFDTCCSQPDCKADADAPPNRFYTYGVIARLAALAAARELEISPDQIS